MRLIVFALAVALLPAVARADDTASAEAAFQEARRLAQAGRHIEACPKFEASYRAAPALGALLNVADCHERIGRTATAWAEFRQAAELARRRVDSREAFAVERATALEPRLVRLTVAPPPSAPHGLVVRRGPTDLTGLLGSAMPVDPGEHVVEASAPGYVTWTQTVDVRGEGRTVVVEIPALAPIPRVAAPAPVVAPPVAPEPVAVVEDPGRRRRWLALSVGGAGLVTVGAGLVVGQRAMARWDERGAHCRSDNVCDPAGRDTVASAQRLATASNIVVGVGAAAIAAGVVLWWTAPRAPSEDESSEDELVWVPSVGGDSVGAAVLGRF